MEIKESVWNGFQLLEFSFEEHDAILVVPNQPTGDKRWLFKTEYFNAFPAFEIEMLEKGYYLAHCITPKYLICFKPTVSVGLKFYINRF